MPFYKIIDWKNRFSGQIIFVERKFLFYELIQISREHLIEIAEQYKVLENPRFENRLTVINAIIDYSHKIAIQEQGVAN